MTEEAKYKYLIKLYKNNIYTYSVYMLRNRMDAEDVTQEVMIRIWKNINEFNPLAAKAWIMKTTHNLCIDFLRKRSNSANKEVSIDEQFEDTFSSGSSEPDELLDLKNLDEKIKLAIRNLPQNLKSVFVLYEIQNMKYKEISKALDIPLNSVKVYILRARKRLQEELKAHIHSGVTSNE